MENSGTMKVRFPISAKLLILVTLLLAVSLSAAVALISFVLSKDVYRKAEENNYSINKSSSDAANLLLKSTRANILGFLEILNHIDLYSEDAQNAATSFFKYNPDIAAVILTTSSLETGLGTGNEILLTGNNFFYEKETDNTLPSIFFNAHKDDLIRAAQGEELLINADSLFGFPMLALITPYTKSGTAAGVLFSPKVLDESFDSNVYAYLINAEGDILVNPQTDFHFQYGELLNRHTLQNILESTQSKGQTVFTSKNGTRYLAAYKKLAVANSIVITAIPYDTVFSGIYSSAKENIFLCLIVLFAAVLIVWFFSGTIRSPLKQLVFAAKNVENGDIEGGYAAANGITNKRKDEIGALAQAFSVMCNSLLMQPARCLESGELLSEGLSLKTTVLYLNLQNFNKVSKDMESKAAWDFMNNYIMRISACIKKTGGFTGKCTGKTVMAHWGAAETTGDIAHDALNAIRTALMIRVALAEFNKEQEQENKPVIQAACGINSGNVIAGQICSGEFSEYTVIGSAVSLAHKTESLNKVFHTDILITEYTWKLVRSYLITKEMPSITIKDYAEPVRIFAVVNLLSPEMEQQPYPTNLAEVRELLNIDAADSSVTEKTELEKKIAINWNELDL
ncbi:MAG: hypothetical protein LBV52_06735 [Spirochaetaceae bacterium]|nr:hypothetical protein [Spirochaetaceae bacterium]